MMEKKGIYELKDLGWSSEEKLDQLGIDAQRIRDRKEIVFRKNGNDFEYLNATVKAYLAGQGVLDIDKISPGIVDIFKIAKELRTADPRNDLSTILGNIERQPELLVSKDIRGTKYFGVPIENIYKIMSADFFGLINKSPRKTLETMIKTGDSLREQVPDISLKSVKYNPFQALSYIFDNYLDQSPHDLAKEIGEDAVKVELLLYKYGKLILRDSEVIKKVKELRTKAYDQLKYSSFSFNAYETLAISQFKKLTGIGYNDLIKLIRHGIFEVVNVRDNYGRISKEISGRSAIYHFREISNGNRSYHDKVIRALSSPEIKLPKIKDDLEYYPTNNAFSRHLKEIKKIIYPKSDEEKSICERIESAKKKIEDLVSTSPLMHNKLTEIYKLAEDDDPTFFDFISRNRLDKNIKDFELDDIRLEYMSRIGDIRGLFLQKERNKKNRSGPGGLDKIDVKIRDLYSSLDLDFDFTSFAASQIKHILWDIRISRQEISLFQKENDLLLREVKKGGGSEISGRYSRNQKKISNKKEQIRNFEGLVEMEYHDLERFVKKIQEYEVVIDQTKEELIIRNLRYVAKCANYSGNKYSWGVEGLIKAVNYFDYKRGYKLSTYATWWIRQSIQRGQIDTGSTIRKPVHITEKLRKFWNFEIDLMKKMKRIPTPQEAIQAYNLLSEKKMTYKKYRQMKQISLQTVSLDAPMTKRKTNEESDNNMIDFTTYVDDEINSAENKVLENNRIKVIRKILATLSPREEEIVRKRWGINPGESYDHDHTLEEIGQQKGLTRERIRQIEARAIRRLRHHTRSKHLRELL